MVSLATPTPAPVRRPPAQHPPARPVARDGFVDAVRALGTALVVLGHWLIPVVAIDGDGLRIGNALSVGAGWAATWVLQSVPLMFFAAGAASYAGRRHADRALPLLRRRLRRLLPPVLVFLAAWLLVFVPGARLLGVPGTAVGQAAAIAPQVLWFVAVYLVLLALTPLCLAAHARWGLRAPAVLALAAVGVDLVRFGGGPSWAGYANLALVWLVPYLLGFAYADGTLRSVRRRTLALAGSASVAALVGLVWFGPYPASMVGMPGDAVSNMNPPTVCLLAVTGYQVAFAVLARGPVLAALRRRRLAALVGFVQARSMTVYLWHLTAMFVLVGLVLYGAGRALPEAWSPTWWLTRPAWYAALAVILAVLVALFSRIERHGLRAHGGPLPVDGAVAVRTRGGGMHRHQQPRSLSRRVGVRRCARLSAQLDTRGLCGGSRSKSGTDAQP